MGGDGVVPGIYDHKLPLLTVHSRGRKAPDKKHGPKGG